MEGISIHFVQNFRMCRTVCHTASVIRDLGKTSWAVAYALRTVRSERHLSLRQLSVVMAESGHPMSHSTLSEIERGDRRVTVDDLTALSAALGIAPVTFLIPVQRDDPQPDPDVAVALTGTPEVSLRHLADWVRGDTPLDSTNDEHDIETFRRGALPRWLWKD